MQDLALHGEMQVTGSSCSASNSQTRRDGTGALRSYLHRFYTKASLRGTNFSKCNLEGVSFFGALAPGAKFVGANLASECSDGFADAACRHRSSFGLLARDADASLESADLEDADLTDANLSGAFLTNTQLKGVKIDASPLLAMPVRSGCSP